MEWTSWWMTLVPLSCFQLLDIWKTAHCVPELRKIFLNWWGPLYHRCLSPSFFSSLSSFLCLLSPYFRDMFCDGIYRAHLFGDLSTHSCQIPCPLQSVCAGQILLDASFLVFFSGLVHNSILQFRHWFFIFWKKSISTVPLHTIFWPIQVYVVRFFHWRSSLYHKTFVGT